MLIDRVDALYARTIGPDTDRYDGSQNKAEFGLCLDHLERCVRSIDADDVWFLEIGAYKGLWALAIQVVCEACGKTPHYVTVTWMAHDPNNRDLLRTREHYRRAGLEFTLIDADSTDPQTVAAVREARSAYHVVFIDGDHRLRAVMADIRNYGPLATHRLIFHDINTPDCGVRRAIERSGVHLHLEIAYGPVMGIGISDRTVPQPPPPRRRWFR